MPHVITCPTCQTSIEVTEVLAAGVRAELQQQYEARSRQREGEYQQREKELTERQQQLAREKETIDAEVQRRLHQEKRQVTESERQKAREEVALDMKDMQAQLTASAEKLREAQEQELSLRRQKQELEMQKQELELTVNRRMDEERHKIREQALQEAAQQRELKDAEKDKQISDLRQEIDQLQRKSEQVSQQLQGEVLELALETLLGQRFPTDEIVPVPRGVHGGDILQHVRDSSGRVCGTILWESKRTRNFSDGWLAKLRDDQRAARADLCVLVSMELPKDVTHFAQIDGVWVASWRCASAFGHVLRCGLIEVARAKQAIKGQEGKMELLYQYLCGVPFRQRVEGIIEAFTSLREDLEAEKKAVQRLWAKREKQLERAVSNTVGFHGDLSGLIGTGLPAIGALELAAAVEEPSPTQIAGVAEKPSATS